MWWNLSISTKKLSKATREKDYLLFCIPPGNGQSGVATRRGTGEAGENNVHYTHRFWMDRVIAHQEGITQEDHQACYSTKWGWGAEKEWGATASALLGVRAEYTNKGMGGFHWNTWPSLGHSQKGRRRTHGRGWPYHTGAPGHLGSVLTVCSWSKKIRSFKIYNIPNKPRKGIWEFRVRNRQKQ